MATTPPDGDQDRYADAAHVLPRWVNYLIEHWLLTFLLLAEAYLLGTLMTLGWVPDIEAPSGWGWFHGVGVVLFFSAGATAAGVALRCSVAAVGAFKRREWGFGLFNLLGLGVFCGVEVWASLSERSSHLAPTPADTAVLNALGFPHAPISPTVLMVALLLPFASLYYGFSQQQRRRVTVDDLDAQTQEEAAVLDRKLQRAQKIAQIRAAQARGLAGVLRGAVTTAQGGDDDAASPLPVNGHRSPSDGWSSH